jgi:hypothetical protein
MTTYGSRSCGGCTMCCNGNISLQVNEHKVSPGNPCPHINDCGCGLYDDLSRPPTCNTFSCAWIQNWYFPEWVRPDKSGFILSATGRESKAVKLTTNMVGDNKVDPAALLWVINWARHNQITLIYYVKNNSEEDLYLMGNIFNHPNADFTMGSKEELKSLIHPSENYFNYE